MNSNEILTNFIDQYGTNEQPIRQFFAPGRVNLLGEHTDYNGGLVLPCAINFGTALLVRQRTDNLLKLKSQNFDFVGSVSMDEKLEKKADHWINYPLGVISQYQKRGIAISGLELLFCGDIPNGAGLSSSASVEVVTAFAINEVLQLGIAKQELAIIARAAENEFVGVNCGIMDQYASAMGRKGMAMKLDCETLVCEHVSMDLERHCFVVVNSNQRRELTESGYNERFTESRNALAIIQKTYDVPALGAVSAEQLKSLKAELGELLYRRARHVVSDNQRVIDAGKLLEQSDLVGFGQVMNASHLSMRDDYEISTKTINTLVELAQSQPGVLGARLTGGGFGGCIVAVIEKTAVASFTNNVSKLYHDSTGLKADVYPVKVEQGVREVLG